MVAEQSALTSHLLVPRVGTPGSVRALFEHRGSEFQSCPTAIDNPIVQSRKAVAPAQGAMVSQQA